MQLLFTGVRPVRKGRIVINRIWSRYFFINSISLVTGAIVLNDTKVKKKARKI